MKTLLRLFEEYPVTRGMFTYAISYPTSNCIAQVFFRPEQNKIDWKELARFSLFGCFWVGPTLYSWIKMSSVLFPHPNFLNAVKKAVTEQFTYGPFAITTFYTGMDLLQGYDFKHISSEINEKFWPTYKTGALYWVTVQTLNFSIVPEKNRVPVMSVASLLWGTFLSFMKHKEVEEECPCIPPTKITELDDDDCCCDED